MKTLRRIRQQLNEINALIVNGIVNGARMRRQARPFVSVWIEGAGITLELGT